MKTRLTFEFIVSEKVFKESSEINEFDDILLKPLRDSGYKVDLIIDQDKHTTFVYEISK
jgi:hypothetical protein